MRFSCVSSRTVVERARCALVAASASFHVEDMPLHFGLCDKVATAETTRLCQLSAEIVSEPDSCPQSWHWRGADARGQERVLNGVCCDKFRHAILVEDTSACCLVADTARFGKDLFGKSSVIARLKRIARTCCEQSLRRLEFPSLKWAAHRTPTKLWHGLKQTGRPLVLLQAEMWLCGAFVFCRLIVAVAHSPTIVVCYKRRASQLKGRLAQVFTVARALFGLAVDATCCRFVRSSILSDLTDEQTDSLLSHSPEKHCERRLWIVRCLAEANHEVRYLK